MIAKRWKKQSKLEIGSAKLKTLQGDVLTVCMNGARNFVVEDSCGVKANLTIEDVNQSNGVINVIDDVLQPGT
jgi:uncharacterized surface protein with fasciclin (FAS1) repeats